MKERLVAIVSKKKLVEESIASLQPIQYSPTDLFYRTRMTRFSKLAHSNALSLDPPDPNSDGIGKVCLILAIFKSPDSGNARGQKTQSTVLPCKENATSDPSE